MVDWSSFKDDEESDKIRESRAVAQEQFIKLSAEHVRVCYELAKANAELNRLKEQS